MQNENKTFSEVKGLTSKEFTSLKKGKLNSWARIPSGRETGSLDPAFNQGVAQHPGSQNTAGKTKSPSRKFVNR